MPIDSMNRKLIAVTDLIASLTDTKNKLLKSSPHPPGQCTVAVDSKFVAELNLVLVRTPSKQPDIISTSVDAEAAAETEVGKKAANIAQSIIKSHFDKKLNGEDYVDMLKKSPMPNVTKEVIKSAQRGDSPISGTHGSYSTSYKQHLLTDLPCDQPQILMVKVEGINPSGTLFTGTVTDPREHAAFWSGFSTQRIFLEAHTQDCQSGLILSKVIDEAVEVEVSLSISMCQGKGNSDVINATLIRLIDFRGIALRTFRALNSQMSLDLDLPDQ
jgi:hypothetical protein